MEILSPLLGLLSIAAFFILALGLIKPSWMGKEKRTSVLKMMGLAFLVFVVALLISPGKTEQSQNVLPASTTDSVKAEEQPSTQGAANEEAEKLKAEAKKAKEEAAQAKEEAEKAKAEIAQAKADTEAANAEKAKADEEAVKAKTDKQAEENKPVEAYKTTAAKLYQDYEANEVATDEKIGGRPVEISGKVESIDKGLFDTIVIQMSTGQMFMNAGLSMEDSEKAQAMKTSKGNKVTIVCQSMSRLIGMPQGNGCVFK